MKEQHWKRLLIWLGQWEGQAEKAEEYLLLPTLTNVLHQSHTRFSDNQAGKTPKKEIRPSSSIKQHDPWDWRLLDLISRIVADNDVESRLYAASFPTEMAAVQRLVKAPPVQYKDILPLLQVMHQGLPYPFLRDQLAHYLFSTNRRWPEIRTINHLILRSSVLSSSSRTLKDLPRRILVKHLSRIALDQTSQFLRTEGPLHEEILSSTRRLAFDQSALDRLAHGIDSAATNALDISSFFYWRSDKEEFLDTFADQCAGAIGSRSPHEAIGKAAEFLAAAYTKSLVGLCYLLLFFGKSTDVDPGLQAAGQRIADSLYERGWTTVRRNRSEDILSTLDFTCARAFTIPLISAMADVCMRQQGIAAEPRTLTQLQEITHRSLLAYCEAQGNTLDQSTPAGMRGACRRWLADAATYRQLGLALLPLASSTIEKFRTFVLSGSRLSAEDLRLDSKHFWDGWRRAFASWSVNYTDVLGELPWQILRVSQLRTGIGAVFDELDKPAALWTIIFQVEGFDSTAQLWRAGDVEFYAPDAFDFGERGLLPMPKDTGLPVSYAKIDVHAGSVDDAAARALLTLTTALDVLAYPSLQRQRHAGLHAKILPNYHAIELATRSWSSGRFDTRITLAYDAETNGLTALARDIQQILSWEIGQRGRIKKTEAQACLLRALHWYRKAKDEDEEKAKFLFYWIALESIVGVGKSKDSVLFEDLPRFSINWRNTVWPLRLRALYQQAEALAKRVSEIPDLSAKVQRSAKLKDMHHNQNVLIPASNVRLLRQHVPAGETDLIAALNDYTTKLKDWVPRKDVRTRGVAAECEAFVFKLHCLYEVRNALAHEALVYSPYLSFYCDEVCTILEQILYSLANLVFSHPNQYSDIEQVIAWYQYPFG